ncbi:response regulator receiver domain-containing protein [Stella humosa]|uniref:Response regulator receiver domain-containing protein n=1 Tax=Stella humosa TaxID=94 RepID=A0A3N1KTT1_9PROT|nr:response regulator [Stella humosa]ROP83394.1 response regulator receiver domain-containing protein [Stella humosa]BBK29822.1 response regulator [Stella humosa]
MAPEPLVRILYVEDDADIRTICKFALENLGGFSVNDCESGADALAAAPAFAPQLLLLDVMMPGMDGPTTLAGLRALPITAETPAVFMTAKVQPHEVQRYRDLGAIDVISKPFDPMVLSDTIRAIWDRRDG